MGGARRSSRKEPPARTWYIDSGDVKLSVLSPVGTEAVVALRGGGDFLGEAGLADRLLAAGLTPLEVSVPHDHADPRVVFNRGTEFVTVIGVGDTIDDAATDIVNQARECGLNRTVAGRWCGQTPRLGSPCSSLVGDRHRAPER
jgi:hypothetical protein